MTGERRRMVDGRREPRFEGERDGFDMRVTRDDRPAPAPAVEASARSRRGEPPRRRADNGRHRGLAETLDAGSSRGGGRPPRRRRRRSFLGRLFYWGFVLSI